MKTYILVSVRESAKFAVQNKLAEQPGVSPVEVVGGPYDLMVTYTEADYVRFVTDVLGKMPEVLRTVTSHVIE